MFKQKNNEKRKRKRIIVDFFFVDGCSGYMSPEYVIDGHFSVKSDVFSFGVLVLEIISGRKNKGFYHPDHPHNLLGHVSSAVNVFTSLSFEN